MPRLVERGTTCEAFSLLRVVVGNVHLFCADYAEEQTLELEALESIFPEEFSLLHTPAEGGTGARFDLALVPHSDESEGPNHVRATLRVEYTSAYPEELPGMELVDVKALRPKQERDLLDLLRRTGEENLGMPMVYTLAETMQEWLRENNRPPGEGSAYEEMLERQRQQQEAERQREVAKVKAEEQALVDEEEAQRRAGTLHLVEAEREAEEEARKKAREGTPVTPETFAAWRAAFEAEMRASAAPSRAQAGSVREAEDAAGDDEPDPRPAAAAAAAGATAAAGAAAAGDGTPSAGDASGDASLAAAVGAGGGPVPGLGDAPPPVVRGEDFSREFSRTGEPWSVVMARPTGRALFESGKAVSSEEYTAERTAAALAAKADEGKPMDQARAASAGPIDASLFAEEDEDDLEGLEDSDEEDEEEGDDDEEV